jgi:hypothetical protein
VQAPLDSFLTGCRAFDRLTASLLSQELQREVIGSLAAREAESMRVKGVRARLRANRALFDEQRARVVMLQSQNVPGVAAESQKERELGAQYQADLTEMCDSVQRMVDSEPPPSTAPAQSWRR